MKVFTEFSSQVLQTLIRKKGYSGYLLSNTVHTIKKGPYYHSNGKSLSSLV